MESEGKTVLGEKCEGSGNSSEVDSDENAQHEKNPNVRILVYFFRMMYVIENVSDC